MYLGPCSYRPKPYPFHWHLWKYLCRKDRTKGDTYSNELQNTPSLGLGKGIIFGYTGITYIKNIWLVLLPNGISFPTTLGDSLDRPMSQEEGTLNIISLISYSPIPNSHKFMVTR